MQLHDFFKLGLNQQNHKWGEDWTFPDKPCISWYICIRCRKKEIHKTCHKWGVWGVWGVWGEWENRGPVMKERICEICGAKDYEVDQEDLEAMRRSYI